ncbi:hypothetical protein [Rhizobacter fulvus]|jgi:hypothetical protein
MSGKEHISARGKNRVREAVDLKLKVLASWARYGLPWQITPSGDVVRDTDGEPVLIQFPVDIKSFAFWGGSAKLFEGKTYAEIELTKVSRSTLNQPAYDTIRASIASMLQVVKDKALSQVERANKSSVIEHLKDELRRTNCILDQQEQDVVRLRREADAARIELGKEKSLRQRNEDELRQQISKLEARTAELTATISKLAPLKRRS